MTILTPHRFTLVTRAQPILFFLAWATRVAFTPIFEHHRTVKELTQENDTHAPLEVSIDQVRQHALPLSPGRLITDADQASAWALALGDY
jgi:hypothetical protein